MRKKLKKYRKSKGFSKKEMASMLGVTTKEYKQIEKDGEIKKKTKEKIKALLKKKKTAEIKLQTGITDVSKYINQITSITNPTQEMTNKINAPLNKVLSLQNLTNKFTSKITALDYLKDINNKQSIGWSALDSVSKFSVPIKLATDNQLKTYKGFQSIIDSQPNSLKSAITVHESLLAGITKPTYSLKNITDSTLFQTITETVRNNRTAYESYIGLSSELLKTLSNSAIPSSFYSNVISTDNFIKNKPSVLDFLSGNTFTIINDNDDFNDELDIITQIESNPEYKKKADSIFNEFHQIVNDENVEEVNEEKIELIYEKFYSWIIKTFSINSNKAKKIATRVLLMLPTIYAVISFIGLKEIKGELEDVKSEQIKHANQERDNSEKLLKINQEILDRINSESSQKMIASRNVNLRTRRSSKSKVLGTVLASQEVNVLEKKIKWMKIIYVDIKDKKPKTGWVWIGYFK